MHSIHERIHDHIEAGAAASPDHVIWYLGEDGWSHARIKQAVDSFATSLLALGYKPGDRVGLLALNQPEWLVAFIACCKLGLTAVGLSVRYKPDEITFILGQSGARGVVTLKAFGEVDYAALFEGLKARVPSLRDVIVIGDAASLAFHDLAAKAPDVAAIAAADAGVHGATPCMIIYTSGTTGRPKGATLTHRSILASAYAQVQHTGLSRADSLPLVLPLNHVGGLVCGAMASLVAGAQMHLIPGFSPALLIDLLSRTKITVLGAVPTMYTLLLAQPAFATLDMGGLRLALVGAAAPTHELIGAMRASFPHAEIMNVYGMSETSGIVVMNDPGESADHIAASIGRPLGSFEARIAGEDGALLPPGKIGELQMRGDAVIAAYHALPDATAETFIDGGWIRTGDLAYRDVDGRIFLKGRRKEMYIQGGFNVYPVEVENVLADHPAVMIAAGIGVPDAILGEVGKYFIIPRPGVAPTADELIAHCRDHLADYKVPRIIEFHAELPLTPAGKVMKAALQ
ncbi:class I adenylate-forming enzyme family protein [Gimibacter soli]|uniref:AMP-binding protein n=1 Tax=Gimibacter soli TaxID=3024400 RepID=A0AAE9XRF3_9PROT|nr:AMP-binding protein [Gimibacter soli]WCL54847.1 AMP-binding protein [Gimibacter soli]